MSGYKDNNPLRQWKPSTTEDDSAETEVIEGDLSPEPTDPFRDASRGFRFIAFLLDAILAGAVALFIVGFVLWPNSFPGAAEELREFMDDAATEEMSRTELVEKMSDNLRTAIYVGQVVFAGLVWIYFSLSMIFWKGASLGKAVFRLEVIEEDGSPPRIFKILFREGLKTACFLAPTPILFVLAYLPVYFTKNSKSFPDLIARTRVVHR